MKKIRRSLFLAGVLFMSAALLLLGSCGKKDGALRVEVRTANGMPRMFIDGEAVAPVIFFGNTDIGTNVTEQAALAAKNGIHLQSCIYNLRFDDDYTDENSYAYTNLRECLDSVIRGDPDAKIILRVKVGAYFGRWKYETPEDVPEEWRGELIRYVDGSYDFDGGAFLVSTASDSWAEQVNQKLAAIIRFMRSSPDYARHIAGIHLENCEWFEYGFREAGSDVSPVNDAKFRLWLSEKYGGDGAFRAAWGCDYGIADAVVPRDLPNNTSGGPLYENPLMLTAGEQRYVDYLDYIGELVSGRIEDFAKTAKEASDGSLMVIAFYGYLFELSDAQSGHYNTKRLLNSPYIQCA